MARGKNGSSISFHLGDKDGTVVVSALGTPEAIVADLPQVARSETFRGKSHMLPIIDVQSYVLGNVCVTAVGGNLDAIVRAVVSALSAVAPLPDTPAMA